MSDVQEYQDRDEVLVQTWVITKTSRDEALRDINDIDGNGIAENVSIEHASLIAAAPLMLDALKEARTNFETGKGLPSAVLEAINLAEA